MNAVFLKLLNMSVTGCVMILAVLIARALLKKAPRWSICLLWGLVAVRLMCPFTLECKLSLIHNAEPITQESLSVQMAAPPVASKPIQHDMIQLQPPTVQQSPAQSLPDEPERKTPDYLTIAGYVWLSGVAAMLLYTTVSYCRLKKLVCTATRLEGNIRQSEYVTSPFVLGMFRPTIYLPYGLKESHKNHMLAHERAHIHRGDHLIKPLGFLILSVHWFNPCVWLAYILLCRDIEAACDERVIRGMSKEQRQFYAATLLHYSVKHHRIAACPVAFGEIGIKGRIKNVMYYKKPTVWLIVMAMLLSVVLAGCFLTDPVNDPSQDPLTTSLEDREKIDSLVDQIYGKLWDNGYDHLHPDWYRIIDSQAREELMAYGDTALEYLTEQLRTTRSSTHSVREQLMVYICEDLAKVIPAGSRYSGGWPEIPGMWLTWYDMKNADNGDQSVLKPGFYYISDVLYGDILERNSIYYDYGIRYMVTEQGLFIRETEKAYHSITAITNDDGETIVLDKETAKIMIGNRGRDYTANIPVEWNWEDAGKGNDLWGKWISGDREQHLEGPGLDTLLTEQNYRYQPLDDDHCIIQTGSGLYTNVYIIGQSNGQLQYVYELSKQN